MIEFDPRTVATSLVFMSIPVSTSPGSVSRSFTLNETAHYFFRRARNFMTQYSPNPTTQVLQLRPGDVIGDSGGNAPAARRGLKRHQRRGRKNDNGFKE